jgi:hypothetical protein
LVLRAISEVVDVDVLDLAQRTRHVRDIWQATTTAAEPFNVAELAVGRLLVAKRQYAIHGEPTVVPGHVGIITALGDMPTFIHASPVTGRVEERPLKRLSTIIGSIAVTADLHRALR